MPRVYVPILWWTERDSRGVQWPIWLTSDDLCRDMRGNLGLTYRDQGMHEIHVWAGQSVRDMHDTVLHEILHLCLRSAELRGEERAVATITPRVLPSLKRNGWQPPPLPDGWRSLAAHARWHRFGSLQRDPNDVAA